MSILVPGEGPLVHRACIEQNIYDLKDWFSAVEMHAWKAVNSYFRSRPDKIFLVTGQTLTSKYALSHKQHVTSECEIYIESNAGVPIAAEANVLLGRTLKKVSASMGFESHSPTNGSERLYSIFLETYESYPTHVMGPKRLLSKLKDMYTYALIWSSFLNTSFFTSKSIESRLDGIDGFRAVRWPGLPEVTS